MSRIHRANPSASAAPRTDWRSNGWAAAKRFLVAFMEENADICRTEDGRNRLPSAKQLIKRGSRNVYNALQRGYPGGYTAFVEQLASELGVAPPPETGATDWRGNDWAAAKQFLDGFMDQEENADICRTAEGRRQLPPASQLQRRGGKNVYQALQHPKSGHPGGYIAFAEQLASELGVAPPPENKQAHWREGGDWEPAKQFLVDFMDREDNADICRTSEGQRRLPPPGELEKRGGRNLYVALQHPKTGYPGGYIAFAEQLASDLGVLPPILRRRLTSSGDSVTGVDLGAGVQPPGSVPDSLQGDKGPAQEALHQYAAVQPDVYEVSKSPVEAEQLTPAEEAPSSRRGINWQANDWAAAKQFLLDFMDREDNADICRTAEGQRRLPSPGQLRERGGRKLYEALQQKENGYPGGYAAFAHKLVQELGVLSPARQNRPPDSLAPAGDGTRAQVQDSPPPADPLDQGTQRPRTPHRDEPRPAHVYETSEPPLEVLSVGAAHLLRQENLRDLDCPKMKWEDFLKLVATLLNVTPPNLRTEIRSFLLRAEFLPWPLTSDVLIMRREEAWLLRATERLAWQASRNPELSKAHKWGFAVLRQLLEQAFELSTQGRQGLLLPWATLRAGEVSIALADCHARIVQLAVTGKMEGKSLGDAAKGTSWDGSTLSLALSGLKRQVKTLTETGLSPLEISQELASLELTTEQVEFLLQL